MAYVVFICNISAQNTIELKFTAEKNGQFLALDSILIMNMSQYSDTTLYYPDTTLVLEIPAGLNEPGAPHNLILIENYPNPFSDRATINVYIPEQGDYRISVQNLAGQILSFEELFLDNGYHWFTFLPGSENCYIFSIGNSVLSRSVKLWCSGNNERPFCDVLYNGLKEQQGTFKSAYSFGFNPGDLLKYSGYFSSAEKTFTDAPESNKIYVFDFTIAGPCPGVQSVEYGGQTYNTVQIGGQCWLRENINIGTMITGDPSNNSMIEKYCYDNDPGNCLLYGGLYMWDEMMQYTTQAGSKGICPQGWHIPTDAEWCTLGLYADPSIDCNAIGWSGINAGFRLKSTSGWKEDGNGSDAFNFTALPSGDRNLNGGFDGLQEYAGFWSSSDDFSDNAWIRSFDYSLNGIGRTQNGKDDAFALRCLKD